MVDNATDKESKLEAAAGYRGYVLFMLIVVYTFNFIDRQIIGILAVPIQAELGVSDTMMGVMRGVAFALFYSTLGVPIAWLADRYNRIRIMTVALSLWSFMTMVCGMISTPVQLFFARMGVGVGEAGGVALDLLRREECADLGLSPRRDGVGGDVVAAACVEVTQRGGV